MIRNIIFDWSGTLADDLGMVLRACNRILEHYGKPGLSREEFRRTFRLPYSDYYRETLPDVPLEELEALFLKFSVDESADVDLLPHAREFLEFCHGEGKRMFLLSAIPEEHFVAQDARLGVGHFFERAYLRVRDKAQEITNLIATHELDREHTVMIGDMRHDMETATAGQIRGFAVLTGYESAAALEEAKPDLVARDLKTLHRLLAAQRELPRSLGGGGVVEEPSPRVGSGDEIHISGLKIRAQVGVPEEELAKAQDLKMSVLLRTKEGFSGLDDEIDKTVDYDAVCKTIRAIAGERPRRLIETLVEDVAEGLLKKFALLDVVELELRKYILPETDHVAVKIVRRR